ncbi:MAG: sulfite exporter TauE/SafE family protein [Curvibacter sp.]|nr:sulfite exporter TauE/SafE family protein [Curvibacter sp.]
MLAALAWTGLLMGLAGGPHCIAMCGAACGAVGRLAPVRVVPMGAGAAPSRPGLRDVLFQIGRLCGYAMAGALAALAVDSLAWLSAQTGALRPVWTLFHVLVLAWGVVLLASARQPAWVQGAAQSVWGRVRPLASRASGVFGVGLLWAFMPCGLLYSALLVAGLSGGVLAGAAVMALFALGSSVSLLLGPWVWRVLQRRMDAWRQEWGTRLAGLLLCAMSGWALWMDVAQRVSQWCQ